jgi:hypothetical protein
LIVPPAVVPNIKSFTLGGFEGLGLPMDLSTCESLEEINLIDIGLHEISTLPPTIRKLNISKNPHLNYIDYDGEAEPWNLPSLEVLDCTSTDLYVYH